jgi:hypothetical protein
MTRENPVVNETPARYAGAVKRRTLMAPAAGLALAAVLLLSGCSFGPLLPVPAGGTGGDSSSSGGDGSGDSGDAPLEPLPGAAIPATFPTDVPLIDGPIAFGMDLGTGWSVIITATDLGGGYDDAKGRLLAAGFTSQMDSTTEDGSFGLFTNDKYQINLTASDDAQYGTAVSYVVVLKG